MDQFCSSGGGAFLCPNEVKIDAKFNPYKRYQSKSPPAQLVQQSIMELPLVNTTQPIIQVEEVVYSAQEHNSENLSDSSQECSQLLMPRKPNDPDADSCHSQFIKTPGRHLKIQITTTPSDSNSSKKPSSCYSGQKLQQSSFDSSPDIKSLKLGDGNQSRNSKFQTVCKDLRTSFNIQKSGLLSPFHSKGLTTVDPKMYERHKKRVTHIVSSSNHQLYSPCSKRSKSKYYHKREGSPTGGHESEQLESIENLYTLKKIKSKVRDRVVQWFDFSTIQNNAGGRNTAVVEIEIPKVPSIRRNEQEQVGRPADQEPNTVTTAAVKRLPYKTFEIKSVNQISHLSEQITKKEAQRGGGEEEEGQEMCVTEENQFKNEINPIKLADIGWCEAYKLSKLIKVQRKGIEQGWVKPEVIFDGFGIPKEYIEECFHWFAFHRDNLRQDSILGSPNSMYQHFQGLKNRDSALQSQFGVGEYNQPEFLRIIESGSQKMQNQGVTGVLYEADAPENISDSSILSEDYFDETFTSSSGLSDDDEAEKFKNALLKSSSKNAKMYILSNHFQENNLLCFKSQERVTTMSMIEEEEDFEHLIKNEDRSPLRLKSRGGSGNQMSPKQTQVAHAVIEEHSLEESQVIQEQNDDEGHVEPAGYDPDIFVATNTTFDGGPMDTQLQPIVTNYSRQPSMVENPEDSQDFTDVAAKLFGKANAQITQKRENLVKQYEVNSSRKLQYNQGTEIIETSIKKEVKQIVPGSLYSDMFEKYKAQQRGGSWGDNSAKAKPQMAIQPVHFQQRSASNLQQRPATVMTQPTNGVSFFQFGYPSMVEQVMINTQPQTLQTTQNLGKTMNSNHLRTPLLETQKLAFNPSASMKTHNLSQTPNLLTVKANMNIPSFHSKRTTATSSIPLTQPSSGKISPQRGLTQITTQPPSSELTLAFNGSRPSQLVTTTKKGGQENSNNNDTPQMLNQWMNFHHQRKSKQPVVPQVVIDIARPSITLRVNSPKGTSKSPLLNKQDFNEEINKIKQAQPYQSRKTVGVSPKRTPQLSPKTGLGSSVELIFTPKQ